MEIYLGDECNVYRCKAIPREAIERTEGCNYFCGEVYSMSLARRPKWSKIKSSVAKHERLDAHTVIGDDAQLARSSHSTVLVKGSYLFVFGGKQRGNVAGGDPSPLNDIRWLDLRTLDPDYGELATLPGLSHLGDGAIALVWLKIRCT